MCDSTLFQGYEQSSEIRQLPTTIREFQNIKIFKRNLDENLSSNKMN